MKVPEIALMDEVHVRSLPSRPEPAGRRIIVAAELIVHAVLTLRL
jgi:hypothetical protein